MDAVFNVVRKGYYYDFWKGKINNWEKWSDIIKKKKTYIYMLQTPNRYLNTETMALNFNVF